MMREDACFDVADNDIACIPDLLLMSSEKPASNIFEKPATFDVFSG